MADAIKEKRPTKGGRKTPSTSKGEILESEKVRTPETPAVKGVLTTEDVPLVRPEDDLQSSESDTFANKTNPDFTVIKVETTENNPELGVSLTVEDAAEEDECICVSYDGDAFECTIHAPAPECPKCLTHGTERVIAGALEPMVQYNCTLCGIFYMRNMVTGAYAYEPSRIA